MNVRGNYTRESYRTFKIKDEAVEKIKVEKKLKIINNISILIKRKSSSASVFISATDYNDAETFIVASFPFEAILDP